MRLMRFMGPGRVRKAIVRAAKKCAKSAISAKGSGGDGNRLASAPGRYCATMRTMRTMGVPDGESYRRRAGKCASYAMRDKGPAGVDVRRHKRTLSALMGIPILWLWLLSPLFHEGVQTFLIN